MASVTITTPAAGATVAGSVPVKATYSGKGFTLATLTVDGAQVGAAVTVNPAAFTLDTTKLADGAHTIGVSVKYKQGATTYRWAKSPTVAVTTQNSVAPTPSPQPGYKFCSWENAQCQFTGTMQVIYGANGNFTAPRPFTGSVSCNNTTFGDPLVGTVKHCEVAPAAPFTVSISGQPVVGQNLTAVVA